MHVVYDKQILSVSFRCVIHRWVSHCSSSLAVTATFLLFRVPLWARAPPLVIPALQRADLLLSRVCLVLLHDDGEDQLSECRVPATRPNRCTVSTCQFESTPARRRQDSSKLMNIFLINDTNVKVCMRGSVTPTEHLLFNTLTPELNPSAQRCLSRFFYWGFCFLNRAFR
jgi:hypothetical protein